jgi:lipoyl(octanoyl) transferase
MGPNLADPLHLTTMTQAPNSQHSVDMSCPIDWVISHQLVPYAAAVAAMESRVAAIAHGTAAECIWLLEHPPIYTAGTSAIPADLFTPNRFPVFQTGRGGQYTYHGPGQRIAYTLINLKARGGDVRHFVHSLERWLIDTLATFGITGTVHPDRVGVWIDRSTPAGPRQDKIAALGIRVRHGVTFHGISLNVSPNLEHFSGIVPCGISEHGVTSLGDLGVAASMDECDAALRRSFEPIFGPTRPRARLA